MKVVVLIVILLAKDDPECLSSHKHRLDLDKFESSTQNLVNHRLYHGDCINCSVRFYFMASPDNDIEVEYFSKVAI